MVIRINGEAVKSATYKLSSDGRIMTMTIRNPEQTVGALANMLSGNPKIEIIANGSTQAVYTAVKMMTINMETVGGVLTVTASLQVNALEADIVEALRKEIADLGDVIEDQATVIGTQSERITAQDKVIAAQSKAITAQTERISAQEKTIGQMSEAVTKAYSAAETAQNAIKAIEEGIADA